VAVDSKQRRYFVVTVGRTGSTLLTAIMADAGADFGMPAPEHWDTARGGAIELPEVRRAADHFRLAFEHRPQRPRMPPARWIWTWHRSVAKRELKRALDKAVFVKAGDLDWVVPHAIKVGYFPSVIISYRPFGPCALSFSQTLSMWPAETMAAEYDRTYRNAVLQMHAYGGCVVSYADVVDRTRTEWATNLSEVTGLSVDALLASRDRRVKSAQREEVEVPILYESAEQTFATVDALSGRAFPPSAQALRNWAGQDEKA
jgi:hypothetical protein